MHSKHLLANLPDLEMVKAERARRNLSTFIRQAWHVIEPSTPYCGGWHIDAICEHLEAVTRGEIRDLLINMPPRHMKSIAVSVMWPVWEWLTYPQHRWLFSSYSASLSTRDSVKCRRLIESPWFQARYGDKFQLTSDQNQKTRFDNDATGYRLATSVGGAGTGEGGDRLVCDDPHNVNAADSDAIRQATLEWWDETMSTRGNNPKTVAKVIVMQRVHEKDLSGHVLEKGGYEHLCLPAEYERTRIVYVKGVAKEVDPQDVPTAIGYTDPRTEEGELLWPERFGPDELAKLKTALGSYGTAGQLQQRPAPRGGGVLKSSWFGRYRQLPKIVTRRIYADTAQKTAERNDYSVLECWGLGEDGKIYLIDLLRGKWEATDLKQKTKDFWGKHLPYDRLLSAPLSKLAVEDKASGTGLIQDLRKEGGIPVAAIQRSRDKLVRAYDVQPSMESGLVMVPENAPWLPDFLSEVDSFTKDDTHAHDDQIDPMMDAVNDLILSRQPSIYDSL